MPSIGLYRSPTYDSIIVQGKPFFISVIIHFTEEKYCFTMG